MTVKKHNAIGGVLNVEMDNEMNKRTKKEHNSSCLRTYEINPNAVKRRPVKSVRRVKRIMITGAVVTLTLLILSRSKRDGFGSHFH